MKKVSEKPGPTIRVAVGGEREGSPDGGWLVVKEGVFGGELAVVSGGGFR
jgi:hypothetical protein